MKLNEKIYYCRKKSGMSQEQLAEIIGVSRQAVSKWETGDAEPELSKLRALASSFGVSADWLLSEDAPEAENEPDLSTSDKAEKNDNTEEPKSEKEDSRVGGTNPYYHKNNTSGSKYKTVLEKSVKKYGWIAGFIIALPGLGILAFGGVMKLITSLMFKGLPDTADSLTPFPETSTINPFGPEWAGDVLYDQYVSESEAMLDNFVTYNPVTIFANILIIAGIVIIVLGVGLSIFLKIKGTKSEK